MKNLKLKLLTLLLFMSPSLWASQERIVETYIPVANLQYELLEKNGIELKKVLFYSNYASPEADISSVSWSYIINTPHDRFKGLDVNLAHIKGLKVDIEYLYDEECRVTIDSSNMVHEYKPKVLKKILDYVVKATELNMKESQASCEIQRTSKMKKSESSLTPLKIDFESEAFKVFRKFKSGVKEAPFIHDSFYLLGYSSDGKIAYIKEYDTDPADMVKIETVIQDLVTDKILWRDEFKREGNISNIDFSMFWKEKKESISQQLKYYLIHPSSSNVALSSCLFNYKNEKLQLHSLTDTSYSKDWDIHFVKDSKIVLSSNKKGEKVIDIKNYKSSHLLDRQAIGYIRLGEDSSRVAVVVANLHRGWEGPPHLIGYDIVGASLDVGFKAKKR